MIVSPIHLGARVWETGFDPEFDQTSVDTSMRLKQAYQKAAAEKRVHFIAASDHAAPSEIDQEHMDPDGHKALAQAIYKAIEGIL